MSTGPSFPANHPPTVPLGTEWACPQVLRLIPEAPVLTLTSPSRGPYPELPTLLGLAACPHGL
eukprot:5273870-Pyramimonas_sp.AAC.1